MSHYETRSNQGGSIVKKHCERCGVADTGFNLEHHLSVTVLLCSYCVGDILRAWKKEQQTIKTLQAKTPATV